LGSIADDESSRTSRRSCRDNDHLRFITAQPCTVCGRQSCEAHHLRFAQPRALGLKVSDEFTVPLCRVHHRELHRVGDEAAWWTKVSIDPIPIALGLRQQTRGVLPVASAATLLSLGRPTHRRNEEIWRAFEIAQPLVLGALLDAASHGLRNLPRIRLARATAHGGFCALGDHL
jgi:hypothetical protein